MSTTAETALVKKMRDAGAAEYGDDLVTVKYHGNMYGQSGVSDLLCTLFGVAIVIEVKAPESYRVKGEPSVEKALRDGPTRLQRLFVNDQLRAGAVAGFAATVEQFMEILHCAAERASGGYGGCGDTCNGHNT